MLELRETCDIADLLHVHRQRIATWMSRYSDWPKPDYITKGRRPIYLWLPERDGDWIEWFEDKRANHAGFGIRKNINNEFEE